MEATNRQVDILVGAEPASGMLRALQFMLAGIALLFAALFTVLNPGQVSLEFFFVAVESPLALALALALVAGALLGTAALLPVILRQRRTITRLRQGLHVVNSGGEARQQRLTDWLE